MPTRLIGLAAPLLLVAGCANAVPAGTAVAPDDDATPSSWTLYQGSPTPSLPLPSGSAGLVPGDLGAATTIAAGTFLPYRNGSTAITYDPAVVPPGATAEVAITKTPYGVVVRLTAGGLLPGREYGAHLHTKPCAEESTAAGPHYQHRPDPAAATSPPSVDPSYANPENEVWLDFTTDATGSTNQSSEQNWGFDPAHPPRSLVIHAQTTRTAAGVAGMAGPRAACLTLPTG